VAVSRAAIESGVWGLGVAALSEAEALRRRHADVFRAFAEEAELQLRYDSKECLDRLEADDDVLHRVE